MPVPLRTPYSKAEAKFNVITEFPKLGLHEAAASGNLGLVEYALEHGQPINSVLDGVLPLHAACAGGHVQVVKLLIEHGADVNAPRLPRRYFNDKNRDASAPIVGTSLSTPLHFAAANGNTEVVTLLLTHGAQANQKDKHGVTPERLARDNNWIECAEVLREWVENQDRDLREREEMMARKEGGGAASPPGNVNQELPADPDSPAPRRRLHVKHSIDTALNMLKTSSGQSEQSIRPNPTHPMASPPNSPLRPFGEYSFNPDALNCPPIDYQTRRPSLPHLPPLGAHTEPRRKQGTQAPGPTQRRPRSAGTGAERGPDSEFHPSYGRGGQGRKLASKISGLFKKGQGSEGSDSQGNTHPSSTPASASTTNLVSPSSFKVKTLVPLAQDPNGLDQSPPAARQRPHVPSEASLKGTKTTPQLKPIQVPPASFLELDNSAPPSPFRPPLPSAVDLHNAIAQHHQHSHQRRDRSRSNATTKSNEMGSELSVPQLATLVRASKECLRTRKDSSPRRPLDYNASFDQDSLDPVVEDGKTIVRPGILRAHNRSGSSGQSSMAPGRSLRFDSNSSGERGRRDPSMSGSPASVHNRLHATASSSSLRRMVPPQDSNHDRSPTTSFRPPPDRRGGYFDEEEEEQDYGEQLPSSRLAPVIDEVREELNPPSSLLLRQGTVPPRSPSEPPLSPIFTNGETMQAFATDFPYSTSPPPAPPVTINSNQLSVPEMDRRGRGDSLSSTSTADSLDNTQSNTSGSTAGSGASVSTPAMDNHIPLPSAGNAQDDEERYKETIVQDKILTTSPENRPTLAPASVSLPKPSPIHNRTERLGPSALDIDISMISSHAQAEALVEKTRQDIIDLASSNTETDSIPLSAKLAALGATLALERKLREQEQGAQAGGPPPSTLVNQVDELTPVQENHPRSVERQHSLENRAKQRPRMKPKDPRRPSTADGLSHRNPGGSFFPDQPLKHSHQLSLSVSPQGFDRPSSYESRREMLSAPYQKSTSPYLASASTSNLYEPHSAPPQLKPRRSQNTLTITPLSRVSSTDEHDLEPEPISPNRKKEFRSISASSKKLNRMGFTVNDQVLSRSKEQNGKLFGGFKSIMQSLKGKS